MPEELPDELDEQLAARMVRTPRRGKAKNLRAMWNSV